MKHTVRTRVGGALLSFAMVLSLLPASALAVEPLTTTPPAESNTSTSAGTTQGSITIQGKSGTYTTIAAAIGAAQTGETIVLGADSYAAPTAPITKRVNLISDADAVITGSVEYQFSTNMEGSDLTVRGITFKGNGSQGLAFTSSYSNAGQNIDITVDDCTFIGQDYGVALHSNAQAYNLTVSNCTFNTNCGINFLEFEKHSAEVVSNTLTVGTGNQYNGSYAIEYYSYTAPNNWAMKYYLTEADYTANHSSVKPAKTHFVSTASELTTALTSAENGETIALAPGDYDVTTTPDLEGKYGTGMIIDQDNITIKAADPNNKPVIYGFSNEFNAGVDDSGKNGQDTIYVSGKNVTLENLKIMPLGGIGADANNWQKTVEVVAGATGFKMINCETLPNTKQYNDQDNSMTTSAGLIHITTDDAVLTGNTFGTGTKICAGWMDSINNAVTEYGKITANENTWTGEMALEGVVVVDGTAYVTDKVALKQAIDDSAISSIALANDITLTEKLTINKNVTIDGNENTIKGQNSNTNVYIEITNGDVTIQNATLTEFGGAVGVGSGKAVLKVIGADVNFVARNLNISNYNRAAIDVLAGTFDIDNCRIDCANDYADDQSATRLLVKGIKVGYDATKTSGTIENTSITNSASRFEEWGAGAIEVYQNGEVDIVNCMISNALYGIWVDNNYPAIGATETTSAVVRISGSNTNVNTTDTAVFMDFNPESKNTASVSISDGIYNGLVYIYDRSGSIIASNEQNNISITGGKFSSNPSIIPDSDNESSNYVASGYTVSDSNGKYIVSKKSSSSGGSSSGSGNQTETEKNPDGSTTTTVTKPDGSTTETTKYPDGSSEVVETKKDGTTTTTTTDTEGNKTEVIENTDGSSKTTVDNKDGSSSTTTVSKSGQVEAEVKLPAAVVNEAADKGEAVALPMPEVPVTSDRDEAATVTVTLPSSTSAKVEIPVENVTSGTVAVLVKADGTEEIIKTTLTTENGVAVTLADGDTVKIVDNSKDFDDVSSQYWGASYIDFATSRNLFSGTSATTFAPETVMTRSMIVTVLASYDGANTAASDGEAWYAAGQQWAMENGISDGTNMDGNLNREQLALMLWNYAGKPVPTGNLNSFVDAGDTSDWAAEAMAWAVENGLISGMGNNALDPQGLATRAQVATIMSQFVALTA